MLNNKKSLGQHWLRNRQTLLEIAQVASGSNLVLEIGPGLGTLTSALFKYFDEVWAVEYDDQLAQKLPEQFPGKKLKVFHEDFLKFDLSQLPENYTIAGNIPYYITGKIVQKILMAKNRPAKVVLLVQKEVAERMAGQGNKASLLSLSSAIYANVKLGQVVPAAEFIPPPKVDSQVVILEMLKEPRVPDESLDTFWKMAHAGFSAPRKKVAGNLASFFKVDKATMRQILAEHSIMEDARAEDLILANWLDLLYYKLNG